MDFKFDSFKEQMLQNKNNRENVFQIVLEKNFWTKRPLVNPKTKLLTGNLNIRDE